MRIGLQGSDHILHPQEDKVVGCGTGASNLERSMSHERESMCRDLDELRPIEFD